MIKGVYKKWNADIRLGEELVRRSGNMLFRLIVSHRLDEDFSEQTSQSVEAMTKYLQNKISFQRDIYERNRTFIGKFLNKITFKKHNYIELNGVILASILIALNETAEVDIYKNVIYYFPYEEAEKSVKRLMELDRQAGQLAQANLLMA